MMYFVGASARIIIPNGFKQRGMVGSMVGVCFILTCQKQSWVRNKLSKHSSGSAGLSKTSCVTFWLQMQKLLDPVYYLF